MKCGAGFEPKMYHRFRLQGGCGNQWAISSVNFLKSLNIKIKFDKILKILKNKVNLQMSNIPFSLSGKKT